MTLAYVFKLEDRGSGNHIQSACDSSGGVSAAVFSQDTLLSSIHMYPGPTISTWTSQSGYPAGVFTCDQGFEFLALGGRTITGLCERGMAICMISEQLKY